MSTDRPSRVLLTGATGFVGRNLYPRLAAAGYEVRCASRSPARAAKTMPGRDWVALDVDRPETIPHALEGCDAAFYLIHGMASGGDYAAREREAAEHFARAASTCDVSRIVYLGGVAPEGTPSRHLRSRIETGQALREGPTPIIELRASMIIGAGSESWRIARDLATRLPLLLTPRWLSSRTQPIAIDDVCFALVEALRLRVDDSPILDLPGPETLSARDLLLRVAALRGRRPRVLSVPLITPRLSSYWIKLVTRADFEIARELVEGLTSDLIASSPTFWDVNPHPHTRRSFDAAARDALAAEDATVSPSARLLERMLLSLTPATPRQVASPR